MIYRIKGWNDHYENNRTRDLKRMDWVPIPNRMDKASYVRLVSHPDGAAHLGAWLAIVEIASRCDKRGTLIQDGIPLTPHDLAAISHLPASIIEAAMHRLCSEVGWLEIDPQSIENKDAAPIPHLHATIPHLHASSRACDEGNGMERNGTEYPPTPHAVPAVASATPEVVDPVTAKIHELAETLCARHPAKTRCGPAEARKLLHAIVNHRPAFEKAPQGRKSERQLWLLGMIDENHAAWCSTDQWRRGYAKGLANWLAPTMMRYLTPPAAEQPMNGSLFADSKTVRAMEIYMARKEAEEAYETDAD